MMMLLNGVRIWCWCSWLMVWCRLRWVIWLFFVVVLSFVLVNLSLVCVFLIVWVEINFLVSRFCSWCVFLCSVVILVCDSLVWFCVLVCVLVDLVVLVLMLFLMLISIWFWWMVLLWLVCMCFRMLMMGLWIFIVWLGLIM